MLVAGRVFRKREVEGLNYGGYRGGFADRIFRVNAILSRHKALVLTLLILL